MVFSRWVWIFVFGRVLGCVGNSGVCRWKVLCGNFRLKKVVLVFLNWFVVGSM